MISINEAVAYRAKLVEAADNLNALVGEAVRKGMTVEVDTEDNPYAQYLKIKLNVLVSPALLITDTPELAE